MAGEDMFPGVGSDYDGEPLAEVAEAPRDGFGGMHAKYLEADAFSNRCKSKLKSACIAFVREVNEKIGATSDPLVRLSTNSFGQIFNVSGDCVKINCRINNASHEIEAMLKNAGYNCIFLYAGSLTVFQVDMAGMDRIYKKEEATRGGLGAPVGDVVDGVRGGMGMRSKDESLE